VEGDAAVCWPEGILFDAQFSQGGVALHDHVWLLSVAPAPWVMSSILSKWCRGGDKCPDRSM
jgi:hypothetical protein